ncbi:MAG: outer membrane beta-barrel protein [Pseudomonadota bacterium]
MIRLLTTAALIAVTSTTALASDVILAPESVGESGGKFYVAARAGGVFLQDTTFGLDAAAAVPTDIVNGYDDAGFVGGAAVGYDFEMRSGFSLRGEVEVGFFNAGIESHTVTALDATLSGDDAFGTTRVTYGMASAAVDVDAGFFSPYVSAGIGIANVNFDNHGIVVDTATSTASGLPVGDVTALDDNATAFAYQIGAGVGFDVTDRVTLELGYRFFGVENVQLTAVDGTESSVDLDAHQGLVGMRFSF